MDHIYGSTCCTLCENNLGEFCYNKVIQIVSDKEKYVNLTPEHLCFFNQI